MNKGVSINSELDNFLKPSTIAIIGASLKEGSVGRAITQNFITQTFNGRSYFINPKYSSLYGRKCYDKISDIKDEIDLVVIAIPSKFIPKVIDECGMANVKSAIIISSGFKESGIEGNKLLEELKTKANKHQIRLIGPNCIGLLNPKIGMNAGFYSHDIKVGNIAMISQSGALATALLDWLSSDHLGISSIVSLGSMVDLNFSDLLEYYYDDDQTEYILLYIENIIHVERFIAVASKVSLRKPIIAIKAGKSPQGANAAMSHTGSMAGDDRIYEAIFKKANVISVNSISEFCHLAKTLSKIKLPDGNQIAIITNGGGPGILATDKLIANGGVLASLENQTVEKLNQILSKNWSKTNPIDVLGDVSATIFTQALLILQKDKNIDGICAIFTTQGISDPNVVAKKIVENRYEITKPLICSWLGGKDLDQSRSLFMKYGIPQFDFPETAIQMFHYLALIKKIKNSSGYIENEINYSTDRTQVSKLIKSALTQGRNKLYESESIELLSQYGFNFPIYKVIDNKSELLDACDVVGFPVAMKIIASEVQHKLDVGGVILNIKDKKEATEKLTKLLNQIAKENPEIKLKGILIEQMVKTTHEFLIGGIRDPQLGPAVMFGKGGSLTELWDDSVIVIPPINIEEARQAIHSTKSFKLIKGFRGMSQVNEMILIDHIQKLGQLLLDFPEIKEIDINPIAWDNANLIALDASIELKDNK